MQVPFQIVQESTLYEQNAAVALLYVIFKEYLRCHCVYKFVAIKC
jgi:hypothetical protein